MMGLPGAGGTGGCPGKKVPRKKRRFNIAGCINARQKCRKAEKRFMTGARKKNDFGHFWGSKGVWLKDVVFVGCVKTLPGENY